MQRRPLSRENPMIDFWVIDFSCEFWAIANQGHACRIAFARCEPKRVFTESERVT
jgi:hypothetical protein